MPDPVFLDTPRLGQWSSKATYDAPRLGQWNFGKLDSPRLGQWSYSQVQDSPRLGQWATVNSTFAAIFLNP